MKYRVENYNPLYGAACPEFFDTLEEALNRKEELVKTLYDTFEDEVAKEGAKEYLNDLKICLNEAIDITTEKGDDV